MNRGRYALMGAVGVAALVAAPVQGRAQDAVAELIDGKANPIGSAQLNQLEQGVQIVIAVSGLPVGKHALHIHETGACEPPFESAGGHFNPTGAEHGFDSAGGPHAGDLPNIYVGEGALQVEYITDRVTLEDGETSLFDDDGSAIVIHEGQDDYVSEPAGDAGNRLACGVIEKSGG
jgi:superoxide dismutase, Cu-Zn family